MYRTEREWEDLFEEMGAFWNHDGNPKRHHAELTEGDHTDQVFRADIVLQDPCLADQIASDIVEHLRDVRYWVQSTDRVAAPAMGAITFGNDVARHFARKQGRKCLFSFAQKHQAGNVKKMIFTRMPPLEGEGVMVAEDVITSGTTVDLVADAVLKEKARVHGYVICILNRSDSEETPDGRSIISLLKRPMTLWTPEECPLCKQGSKPIRPKEGDSWRLLNAEY